MNVLRPNTQYTDRAAYMEAYGEGIHAKTRALARLMAATGIHRICSSPAVEELLLRTALLYHALNRPFPDFSKGLFTFSEQGDSIDFNMSDLNLHLGMEISNFPFDFFGRDNGWFPGKTKGMLEFARLINAVMPVPLPSGEVPGEDLRELHARAEKGLARVDHYALSECARRRNEQVRARWKMEQTVSGSPFDPARPLATLHHPGARFGPVLEEYQPEIRDSAYDDAYVAWLNADDHFGYTDTKVRDDFEQFTGRANRQG